MVSGFNAPEPGRRRRATSSRGRQIQLAVFGDERPAVRPAQQLHLDRVGDARLLQAAEPGDDHVGEVGRAQLDPRSTRSCRRIAKIEKLADGFQFTEGPVWVRDGGYLLFSDPNDNRHLPLDARRPALGLPHQERLHRRRHRRVRPARLERPDARPQGRLTIDEHGNRRVTRLEKNGALTVLADRYEGKRLNSPNDLVYKSDGALYFTDPPFGLPKFFDDPRKELPYSGVFRVADGKMQLVAKELTRPERPRLLARREVPLRRQLGREEEGRDALPGPAGRHARERRGLLRHDRRPARTPSTA